MDTPSKLLPLIACVAFLGSASIASAAAPTINPTASLIAVEDVPLTITYAQLLAATGATDPDLADVPGLQIRLVSQPAGDNLRTSANAVVAVGSALSSTIGPWEWTAPADLNGDLEGFVVEAFAGGDASAVKCAVRFNVTPVNDIPTFSGAAVSVAEDSTTYTSPQVWATGVNLGANEPAQAVLRYEVDSFTNPNLFTVDPAVDNNGRLSFTLAPNENGVSEINVRLIDNGGTANGGVDRTGLQNYFITVTPVPDDPTLAVTFAKTSVDPILDTLPAGQTSVVFSAVAVTDVDHNKPDPEELTVNVTLPADTSDLGTFTLPGFNAPVPVPGDATKSIYRTTATNLTPAQARDAILGIVFDPLPNGSPVALYRIAMDVKVTDKTSRMASQSGEVFVKSVNDTPVVTTNLSPTTFPDGGEVKPFRLSVSDADKQETFSVTITEIGGPLGTLTPPTGGFPITGTAAQVATAIRDVRYAPTPLSGANAIATFRVSVVDTHPPTVPAADPENPVVKDLTLEITFSNDPTEFAGVSTEIITMNDNEGADAVFPFSGITLADADTAQILTLTLSLDDPAKGRFDIVGVPSAPTGLFAGATAVSPGTIREPGITSIKGTASAITDILRRLIFVPTPDRVPINLSETVTITLRVSDGLSQDRTNSQTQIEVTSVNGAPRILWDKNGPALGRFPVAETPAKIDPSPSAKPFALVTIEDEGDEPMDVTVSLDDPAKGELVNLGGFTETETGSRVYAYTGQRSLAVAALQNLEFVPSPAYLFPPNQPGRSDFTIVASDSAGNETTRVLPIVLISEARNFLVTNTGDSETVPGTLRHAVKNAKNDDTITFALPSYPATIRLSAAKGTLVINKHLNFRGPGADRLTISGDTNASGTTGTNDTRIFEIYATVKMQGLRLSRGFAETGGAIYVGRSRPGAAAGSLSIADCIISDCVASRWGGAIDVEDGQLSIDRCAFERNSLTASAGQGGGAVSLYTNEACTITNSTFSKNVQPSTNGIGGGALYVENYTANRLFNTKVTHCTFAENIDLSAKGSAIHNNVANSRIDLTNNIFNDASSRNLAVAGGAEIVSIGGNISDDNTSTTFIQGGVPQQAVILNKTSDRRSTSAQLAPIGFLESRTRGYRLLPGSPAVGNALGDVTPLDQRGVIRGGGNDIGAVDASAMEKLVIHEIFALKAPTVPPAPASPPEFIEFFNPRDQGPIDIGGFQLWVNGQIRHVFPSPQVINSGFGIIVSEGALPAVTAGNAVATPPSEGASLGLSERGLVELRMPWVTGTRVVADASYVAVYADSSNPANNLNFDNNSITLAPQFQGNAFVPHKLVLPPPNGGADPLGNGSLTSPGADSGGTPFGAPNAFPIALGDTFEFTEDEILQLPVLANDFDADGSDKIFVVDIGPELPTGPPADNATALTLGGASIAISPFGNPLRGAAVTVDARSSYNYLPEGTRITDSFAYSIIDVGGGAVTGYTANGATETWVGASSHRLEVGDQVIITGSPAFNGTHIISAKEVSRFSIPFPLPAVLPGPAEFGNWQAAVPRTPTERGKAVVQITVRGVNDPPLPVGDQVFTNEETVLRIFADPNLAGIGMAFNTDALYPAPRQFAAVSMLANDSDPDTDDNPFTKLNVIGVTKATGIAGFSAASGSGNVKVSSPGHGLANATTVLISGYGGDPSYNGYHIITVSSDPDSFDLPIPFRDDNAQKGLWAVLNDGNRFSTTSALDAEVTLDIRANRIQTNAVYNPRPSAYLDGLAFGETETDFFYYAVEDTHGAVSLAKVSVDVAGVNDAPVPSNDPQGLANINPIFLGGFSIPQFFAASDVLYEVPSSSGNPGTTNVAVRPPGGDEDDIAIVADIPKTDEDTPISLLSADLLSNDSDVDRSDGKSIQIVGGQNKSRSGADISLGAGGNTVIYDPRLAVGPTGLQALSEGERVVDTFEITVFDGIARVSSVVAVLVEGRNDQPIATNITFTTPENVVLIPPAPGVLVAGTEIDQNVKLPDDRKFLFPTANFLTNTVAAKVDVTLEQRFGNIDAITAAGGVTALTSPAHGLQTGEEVVLQNSGVLTGQYPVTRTGADTFSVNVPYQASFAGLSGGSWRVLLSTFKYDPTVSNFGGGLGGPAFTLQGLAVGQTYSDSYEYSLLDGSFLFANDDIFRIEADRSDIELQVLLNDTNLEGIATSRRIIAVSKPTAGGTVSINAEESLIYSPQTGFVGDEIMVYTIEDDLGNRDTAKVTARVTIDRLNGNLRANADNFTVAKGQAPLLDVLANDAIIPAAGNPLQLTGLATAPDQGGQAVAEGGKVRYTPDAAATVFPYTETFSYTISGGGTASATATATILVLDRSNLLNVRDDSFSVAAVNTEFVLNVIQNDNVLPGTGDALTVESVGTAANGSVRVFDGIAVGYTPNAGYLGTDTFTYTVSDGLGGGGTATVTVQVGYLTTNNDFFSVVRDDNNPATTADNGPTELDVLANDNVLQGGAGLVEIISVTPTTTALGVMSVTAGGASLSFDPAPGQIGQGDYIYTIRDAGGRTATGSVTVVVLASGIRASSDFYTVQTDSEENELDVLSNDRQISTGVALSIVAIGTGADAPAQGGTAVINPAGDKIIYTPASGFRGVETFTYTVTDGNVTDTASVSVRSTIGALAAGADNFLVFRGSENNRLAVLGNDRVIPDNGQLLFVTAIGLDSGNVLNPPNRGTLEIIENGAALRYTPSPDNTALNYVETFTYEISSGGTSRSQALITIEVLDRVGVRNLETNHDLFSVRSDSAGSFLSVLANDGVMPASASGWFITEITPPTANVCSAFIPGDFANPSVLAAKLVASADPLSNFLWLRFSPASQAVLASPSSTDLQLQIVLVNELNAVVNSGASIHDGTRFGGVTLRAETQELLTKGAVGEQLLVLNRLLLEDGFPVEIRQSSSGGSVQIINNEVFYAPQQGFVGTQRFTYRVSDGLGGTGFAEVIVKVGDISVSDDAFTLVSDSGTVLLDVTANDGILRTGFPIEPDPDQADFTLSQSALISVNPPTAGVAVPSGELVSFTPSPAFSGRAVLTYQVDDDSGCRFPGIAYLDIRAPGGDRDKATVTINVTGVNDEPFILGANPSTTDDRTALRPFENATVIEYDNQRTEQVVIRITYPSNQGTLTGNFTEIAPGVLEFTGTAAQITAAIRGLVFTPSNNRITVGTTEDTKFTVSLDDGAVTTPVIVESAVTTVVPINDAPVITGTVAAQKLYQRSVLRPFAGVNITDVDDLTLQPLLVSVTVNDAIDGKFTNLGGFTEQPSGSGIYVFNGSAANSAAALRALVFEPTTGNRIASLSSKTVNFTLSVNDGFLPAVVDTVTSVILLHGQVDNLLPLNATGQDISEAAAAYGSSVAVSGDTMAVGSPGRNTPGGDAGRVYIYERNAGFGAPWGQVAEIIGSDTVAGDRFGESVAIDGNFMVVGASRANPVGANSGAAYVFQRSSTNPNSWIQVAKLVPNATGFADGFGTAVALQAGSILVGAPYAFFPNHFFAGKVFAYELGVGGPGNWVRTQIISPAENLTSGFASEGAFFGFSLAFDGNTAVIGAYGANRSFARNEDLNHGAAYVFERTAQGQPWTEFKRIDRFNDSDSKPYDSIGYSVDISGDRIVVGQHATASLAGVFNSGGARIYERNIGGTDRWGLAKAIDASDNPLSKNFGYSVSISGDFVMIGSPTPSQGVSENRGFTEVYRREIGTAANWNMIDRVSPGSAASSDRFGHAVAIDGFTGLIGSTTNSVNGSNIPGAGRAMVYQFQYDLGPRLIQAIPNQIAENGIPFSFSVDPATFDDPVPPGNLAVNLSLQDGSPLPPGSWLSFDQNLMRFTGTPSPTNKASYDLVLTATNSQGSQVASNVFRIETTFDLTVAYSAWASTHFTPAELNNPALKATLWGMSANPDGDDSSNLLEMLFGTDPKSPDVPEIVFTKLNATQVSLEFARSLEFPADEYEVEWSINLVDWFTTGVSTGELAGDPGFVDVTSVVTSSVIQPKIFVRVVVGR